MRILNADGSEAGACGNGTRCVAWMLMRGDARAEITIETAAGALVCRRLGEWRFSVEMGAPRLEWRDIPLARDEADTRAIDLSYGPPGAPILRNPAVVNMGNPHAIFFVDDIGAYDLAAIGPALEHDSDLSRTRQYFAGAGHCARPHRTQSLGARRRPDAGLRLGRLRRPRRRLRDVASRAVARASACPAAISTSSGARATAWWSWKAPSPSSSRRGSIPPFSRMSPRDARQRSARREARHLRLPAQPRRIGGHAPRGYAPGPRQPCHRQYMRGDGRGDAAGAPGDPPPRARKPLCRDHRHRLRGRDRPAALRRNARGRARHRQRPQDRSRRLGQSPIRTSGDGRF